MGNSIIISVIIPCFNCEKYISRCIESVLAQSFIEYEVILINDGSTDNTGDICKEYSNKYHNIQYYEQENHGVSYTRKRGTTLAKGDYIAFVDSDDYLQDDYLETLYTPMKEESCEVVCCNSVDEAGTDDCFFIKQDRIIIERKVPLRAYLDGERYAYCIWGKLIAKNLLTEPEFPNMKYSEDAWIVQKVFLGASKVKLLSYAGYYYTDNPMGAMSNAKGVQQPMDIVKCDVYIMKLINANCEELLGEAFAKLNGDLFSLLINASVEKGSIQKKALEVFDASIKLNPSKELMKSSKGIVMLGYRYFPHLILKVLSTYSKIKHREN